MSQSLPDPNPPERSSPESPMSREKTQRVFAMSHATQDAVHLLGFGVYVGDEVRPGTPTWDERSEADREMYRRVIRDADANPFDPTAFYDAEVEQGRMTREAADEALANGRDRHAADVARPLGNRAAELALSCARNPKIILDNGDVVWGCECWWGDESRYEETVAGREVITVSMPALRAAAGIEEATDGR